MFMKRILLSILLILSLAQSFAKGDGIAGIAHFKIMMVSNQVFTYSQLKKKKPVVLIYFSPSCEHCQKFTAELVKHKAALAEKQIIMVAYEPLDEVKKFYVTYGLAAYPNIKVGTEGYSFIVQQYYQIQRFPFIAIYNKNNQLSTILTDYGQLEKLVATVIKP